METKVVEEEPKEPEQVPSEVKIDLYPEEVEPKAVLHEVPAINAVK